MQSNPHPPSSFLPPTLYVGGAKAFFNWKRAIVIADVTISSVERSRCLNKNFIFSPVGVKMQSNATTSRSLSELDGLREAQGASQLSTSVQTSRSPQTSSTGQTAIRRSQSQGPVPLKDKLYTTLCRFRYGESLLLNLAIHELPIRINFNVAEQFPYSIGWNLSTGGCILLELHTYII